MFQLASSLKRSPEEIEEIAGNEYDSMAAKLEPLAVRSLFFLIAPFINKIFSHIFVNVKSLDNIRKAMLKHPVVLLPSHKSYLDFILLDIALYICDMPLPTIAAATDFSSMKGVGEWLRKCGAFFVQRGSGNVANLMTTTIENGENGQIVRPLLIVDEETKQDKWKYVASDYLHRVLLAEYIHQLMVDGDHRFLEFFIEGKRSRTGKGISPKRGLLNSVAEAYLLGNVDDIFICPVSICYDRFLEENLYARELLGTPKPKESTMKLLQSLKSLTSTNYGSVVFTFGDTISLREMSNGRINRQLHALHPAWISAMTVGEREFLQELALHIVDMHHRLTSLPVFSLVAACFTAMAVNNSHNLTCSLSQLTERVSWMIGILTASHRPASLSLSHSLDSTILQVLRLHSNILKIDVLDASVSVCPAENEATQFGATVVPFVQLGIYRNQTMFALFPFTAIALTLCSMRRENVTETDVETFYQRFAFLSQLLKLEFVSSETFDSKENRNVFNRTLNLMSQMQLIFKHANSIDVKRSADNPDTQFMAQLLVPFTYAYSVSSFSTYISIG